MAVRIVGVDIYGYDLHYAHGSYVMSGGRDVRSLPSTLVRVRTDDGIDGWGEACPLGGAYLDAFAGGVRSALAELTEKLIGLDPRQLAVINDTMDGTLLGQRAAKSPLDVACWDILGKSTELPLCTLLGGRRSEPFALYVAVPLGSAEEMARHASARAAEGIQRFQLKLGGDPHEDAVRTRAVREAIGDGLLIVADANGGWRRHDAATAARLLENIVGVVLEQPCPTLEECLGVRQRTTLPMSLDEVIIDLAALTQAAALHAMEAINLKIGRVGGLTAARAMRDAAVALGVQMTIEDSWGGDVVTAAVSHLAASTPSEALLSVSFMNDWVTDHIAGHEPHSTRGVGMAPDRPGLGIEVDVERLGPPLATIGLS